MQLFEPSMHTKLVNLALLLGVSNSTVEPRLFSHGYQVKSIGLRISLPELGDKAVTPDTGFSNKEENSVLFIECKSGGMDTQDNPTQLDKFSFVQKKVETVLRTKNEFEIQKTGLEIDFAILCSDLDKIISDHETNKIIFPVLSYNAGRNELIKSDFNQAKFRKPILETAFSSPIPVKRIPVLLYPFGPCDLEKHFVYIVNNVFLCILEENMNLNKFERMPPLNELVLKRFPLLRFMGKEEFSELVAIIEKVLSKIFPDVDPASKLNIRRYITHKKGKVMIKRSTIRTFLERMENVVNEISEKKRQSVLSEFTEPQTDACSVLLNDIDWANIFPDETKAE